MGVINTHVHMRDKQPCTLAPTQALCGRSRLCMGWHYARPSVCMGVHTLDRERA